MKIKMISIIKPDRTFFVVLLILSVMLSTSVFSIVPVHAEILEFEIIHKLSFGSLG